MRPTHALRPSAALVTVLVWLTSFWLLAGPAAAQANTGCDEHVVSRPDGSVSSIEKCHVASDQSSSIDELALVDAPATLLPEQRPPASRYPFCNRRAAPSPTGVHGCASFTVARPAASPSP